MNKQTLLRWEALEYEEKERSNDWFWALGVIMLASIIASIIYKNYFFAILILLGGTMFFYFALKKPEHIEYELGDKGLRIHNFFLGYEKFISFHVQVGIKPMLLFKAKRFFSPITSIPIKEEDAMQIKKILSEKNIPEEEMEEHTYEKVMNSLGF
jgi:hypothetical protein